MERSFIYLDYNATTPVEPEVVAAMAAALETPGNPSSTHAAGRAAHTLLNTAREQAAAFAGVAPRRVIFTSGGTEANNTALRRTGAERLMISAVEHPSVGEPARRGGKPYSVVPVTADGVVDMAALADLLAQADPGVLVSVMAANNETGVIQPVAEIAEIAHRHGALFHTDAVQAAGKISLDEVIAAADLVSISAHKLGGPKGVGALVVPENMVFPGLILGGGQEFGLRGGTENLAGIVGFGAALEAVGEWRQSMSALAELRDRLEAEILEIAPQVYIAGRRAARLPNTSCLSMPGVAAETQVMAFDLAGIAVSAGAACSSGKVRQSAVLTAMDVDPDAAQNAIRVSLGADNDARDVERFIAVWRDLYERSGADALEAETG